MESNEEKKLIRALKVATNGFTRTNTSTLMGWSQSYDEQGRPTTADPNYRDGQVDIAGVDYYYTVKGWYVRVWDKPARYTDWMAGKEDHILEIDMRPAYLKTTPTP